MPRCPATDTLTIDGQDVPLRCIHWGPDGRHPGDHEVHTAPAMGDDHTWPNDDPPAE